MTTDLTPRPRNGTRRFDRLLEVIVGAFAVPFALQTSDAFLADLPTMRDPVGGAVVALVAVSVLGGLVAGISRANRRALFVGAFLLYVAALAVWPFAVDGRIPAEPMPWLAAVAPVPCAYVVAVARSWLLPIICGALISVDLTLVLALLGGLAIDEAAINGVFVFAITGLLTVVVGGVRRAVVAADAVQQAALARYATARLDHATEDERLRTDALVHDRVLTTFLSAAAARTAEDEELAARMATTALRMLAPDPEAAPAGPRVPLAESLAEATPELAPVLRHVDLRLVDVERLLLPARVGEAIVQAMTQAMVNSVAHAGPGATRSARIEPLGVGGVRVVVEDDGAGFDPALVSADRLGVRVSIVERMRRVAGRADIDSAPGRGTRVELLWAPDLEPAPDPVHDRAATVPA